MNGRTPLPSEKGVWMPAMPARLTTVAVVAALVCALTASSAGAQSTTGAPGGVLNAVSCPAAGRCMAVGSLHVSATDFAGRPVALALNGGAWAPTPVSSPRVVAGGSGAHLFGVDCPTVRFCAAVGDANVALSPSRMADAAQRFDGTRWRRVRTPATAGTVGLFAVACASPRLCVASGAAIVAGHNNAYVLVDHGSGYRSTAVSSPAGPAGSSGLSGIDCPTSRFCLAVGEYAGPGSSKNHPWAERYDGVRWRRVAAPNPSSGPNGVTLSAVSCPRAGDCLAVGRASTATASQPVLMRLRAGRLRLVATPSALAGSVPVGVSCQGTSATCELIAQRPDAAAQVLHTLAVSMTAGAFGAPLSADVPGAGSQLPFGVSCPPSGPCTAVGSWSPDPRGDTSSPYAQEITPTTVTVSLSS
jgi:hypothetical protein